MNESRVYLRCRVRKGRWLRGKERSCQDFPMNREDDVAPLAAGEGLHTEEDQLELSEHGLDWGDISQLRENLKLTPTERLRKFQRFMNGVLRIRAQNEDRR
jgi:hypothetical protein